MALQNKKSLGQHWLKDRQILDDIADLALGTPAEVCLEIGPGLGTLTSSLLRRFKKVIAVEYDDRLAANLPKSFPGKDLQVIHADILDCDFSAMPTPYVVAGNIPYYITSPIIMRLLSVAPAPAKIVLLIQKEVAERLLAGPGNHSVLSLTVQNLATVEPGFVVPKAYFTPPPKVDSATVVLTPREQPLVSPDVISLVKRGFSAPRKKLAHNHPFDPTAFGLAANVRPAELTLDDWARLAEHVVL